MASDNTERVRTFCHDPACANETPGFDWDRNDVCMYCLRSEV